ncbi:HAD-IA family hydrolase [Leucobacter ruminantium]|uniref:HAD-IA family hydrolase n=1 Tax=Leucobacter ruminantium TaxID=1289170 RepID=A0A939RYN4_9MICO|nr:HAD-IA family hydrolase [Leucobacter ruminantium]MBO1805056.1 HAD-IA family hydrolase [Leucobacter ruminantium]
MARAEGASASRAISVRADALLFDMDGTIADSVEAVEYAWAEWAREMGVEPPDLGLHHGRTAVAIASDVLPASLVEQGVRRISEIESDPSLPCSPTPGALELIGSLPRDRWGVVTSAVRSVAMARLTNAGIGEPQVFVSGDEVARSKPDPEPFRLGRERIGAGEGSGRTVLAFEDTATGLRSARAAGCTTVGIIGTESRASLAAHADFVITGLTRVRVEHTDESGVMISIAPVDPAEEA